MQTHTKAVFFFFSAKLFEGAGAADQTTTTLSVEAATLTAAIVSFTFLPPSNTPWLKVIATVITVLVWKACRGFVKKVFTEYLFALVLVQR